MNKIAYIFLILIVVSCKNNEVMKMESVDIAEEYSEVYEVDKDYEEYKYQNLTTQKLQDYFDLLKLKEKHPEFKGDIELQLKNFSNNSIPNYTGDYLIENIHQVGGIEKVSDSVQKIKLLYDIVTDSNKIKDSIYVNIISKTILLDNEEIKSNKVTFSKNK